MPTSDFIDAIYREKSYYQGAQGSIGFQDYASLEPARRKMFARHLARIESVVRVGKILDVGCANGDFLKVARDRGWQVFGADPSAARADVEAAGIPLVGNTVLDAAVKVGSLDAVTFWDVLEHVADPVANLARARALLKPGGVVVLTVPDSANLVARVSGRRWFGYKTAGEHLQFYTDRSLRAAFEKAGLAVSERHATTWTCTFGFLADRMGLYLGPPGRLARAAIQRFNLAGVVVDVPQINQFAMGAA
ncbi:MAG TPA: class I SAM-dependent methyltransferase [Candidatus Dormibacteraeota bacterium]|nr:class I SAM-dependent methyltransferase [Candidatus Dormibacteraeota bacterium]